LFTADFTGCAHLHITSCLGAAFDVGQVVDLFDGPGDDLALTIDDARAAKLAREENAARDAQKDATNAGKDSSTSSDPGGTSSDGDGGSSSSSGHDNGTNPSNSDPRNKTGDGGWSSTTTTGKAAEDRGVTGARGSASGRDFDPDAAGGPTQSLNAADATIDQEGVSQVGAHLHRFAGEGGLEAPEQGMLDRLTSIASGEMEPTIYDQNFYTHELDEAGRYAELGYGPESGADLASPAMYDVWNNVHSAALEDYGVSGAELFHPGLAP
jgi:hypothetical protein